ncbi:MAG TPA: hypothetical protein VGP46_13340 [Acidimicrobiales bacterium]|jgi:hypothetical protein|nr:hypothetical protein [Acidimicrobiales bacterium]
MTTALLERVEPQTDTTDLPEPVQSIVGAALRIVADPTLTEAARIQAMTEAALYSAGLLGRAWLHVATRSLRNPSRVAVAAEGLLRQALDHIH